MLKHRESTTAGETHTVKEFRLDGVWWVPQQPDKRQAGTLSFHHRDGLFLSLIEPFHAAPLSSERRGCQAYEVLQGHTAEGMSVNLLRCQETFPRVNLEGDALLRTQTFEASCLLVGFHVDSPNPLLSSVEVSFEHLSDWWGRSNLDIESMRATPGLLGRYVAPTPVLLHDSGDFRVSLREGIAVNADDGQASIRESVTFVIEAPAPRSLAHFQRCIQICSDFLSVASSALCEIRELDVEQREPAGRKRRGKLYAASAYQGAADTGCPIAQLFGAKEFERRLPSLFKTWFLRAEELHFVRALYFAGAYGDGPVEGQLLSLTQAAEAFHRRCRAEAYLGEQEFQRNALAPVLAAIPKGADERLRQAMITRLRYANKLTQRQRFRVLFREYVSALETLTTKPMEYVDPIIDYRNGMTFFDPISPSSAREVPLERMRLFKFLLRLLLEACFLESMGFTRAEIVALLKRSAMYRYLALRFRPWGIEGVAMNGPVIGRVDF